ncbi:MAG: arsenosugar biosynthesis radical SAM (seleno)protein ArsS [Bdellovibrionota bacterium]
MGSFETALQSHGLTLTRSSLETLQINLGRLCNQTCRHCHVDAGPKRPEILSRATADRCLELLRGAPGIRTVDLTGGAPEMNPGFRELVRAIRAMGRTVIDRCNLTVLFEPGQETTAQFLADNQVQIVASLPCYSRENVDEQRGDGVFEASIRALKLLNQLGYAREGSGLTLDLVYNPGGPSLPPPQSELEKDYKSELRELFGIEFNRLFAITNMPIRRFRRDLEKKAQLHAYQELLERSFNPAAADALMCRSLVSVSWDGKLFDCDFNQMLALPLGNRHLTIHDISSLEEIAALPIAVGSHCFGCTAGAGSSCGGALA